MKKKIFKFICWGFIAIVFWCIYLLSAILNYPVGSLSDDADAAVVLGAAVYKDKPSPVFAERINHSINLYHAGKVKKLVFTGGIAEVKKFPKQIVLAESIVAQSYAINKEVAVRDIFIEATSKTTKQNLINAKQIIERNNFGRVLIISDALHLKRAMMMAKDLGIHAQPSATPSSRYQSFKTKFPFALRELYFYNHYLLFSK